MAKNPSLSPMNDALFPSRRCFLRRATGLAACSMTLPLRRDLRAGESGPVSHPLRGRIYKTLKIGMVKPKAKDASLTERFRMAKEAGFAAIELNLPGENLAEVQEAIVESGLPVDGSVCAEHWNVRHTDPDPDVRARALENLEDALRDTNAVGGHTVLLVVGHGKDGPEEEIWDRSVENISQAIPLAAELGVFIAIENVWNHFGYDHGGGADQTADKLARYVDAFSSPWVGMQFDIGNHWKYGNTGDWIRTLGQRIVKLDAKGFSREKGQFTKIGEGDLDWAGVRKALAEINYYGYCAAEVGGGDAQRLREISANMDRVFGLA